MKAEVIKVEIEDIDMPDGWPYLNMAIKEATAVTFDEATVPTQSQAFESINFTKHRFTSRDWGHFDAFVNKDQINKVKKLIGVTDALVDKEIEKRAIERLNEKRQYIQDMSIARERGRIKALSWWKRLFNKID